MPISDKLIRVCMRLRFDGWVVCLLIALVVLFAPPARATTICGPGSICAGTNVHPRIMLTPAVLQSLRSRASRNTPEWLALKSWVDANMGATSLGFTDSQTLSYMFALVYQVTGDTRYADRAIDAAMQAVNGLIAAGQDPPNPNGFTFNLPSLAATYDWTYPRLQTRPADLNTIMTYLARSAEYWIPRVRTQFSPSNNYYPGVLRATAWIAIATYGDYAGAQTLFDTARSDFQMDSLPVLNGVRGSGFCCPPLDGITRGGAWPEGVQYFPETTTHYLAYTQAVKTGTGEDVLALTNFVRDLLSYTLAATSPMGLPVSRGGGNYLVYYPMPYGDAQAGWQEYLPYFTRAMMLEVVDTLRGIGATTEAAYGQYWLDNMMPTFNQGRSSEPTATLIYNFIFADRDFSASVAAAGSGNYLRTDRFPLDWFASGMQKVVTRSDWGSAATWAGFDPLGWAEGHGHADCGQFQIYRKGRWLTREVLGYADVWNSTEVHSTVIANNHGCYPAAGQWPAGNGAMVSFSAAGPATGGVPPGSDPPSFNPADFAHTYYRADLTKSYQPKNVSSPDVTLFLRDFLYIKPDLFVVADRVKYAAPSPSVWLLQAVESPSVSGNVITLTNTITADINGVPVTTPQTPQQVLYAASIVPASPQISVVNLNTVDSRLIGYRAEIRSGQTATDDQFLVVMQAGDLGTTPALQAVKLSTTGSGVNAAKFDRYVVAVSTAASGVNFSYKYQPTAPVPTRHVIVGLPAGVYSVTLTVDAYSNRVVTIAANAGGNGATTPDGLLIFDVSDTAGSPTPTITVSSLSVTSGSAVPSPLTASGGTPPYTWSIVSGSLPAGLTLASNGQISGTTTAVGTFSLTVRATDSSSQSTTQTLTITVKPPPSITTSSLPSGIVNAPFNTTLAATGGTAPYTWSIASSSLPAGLALASTTGVISGTPTAAGTSTFTLRITDSTTPTPLTADKTLSITVIPALVLTTAALPNARVAQAYSATLAASGGTTPYTWSVASGSLPAGLSLASTTGVISGTPTAAGTSTFTLRVTDASSQSATQTLSITIVAPPSITTSSLPGGIAGAAYNTTLAASGGTPPYTWSLASGSLPAGLTLATATGVISGTPTAAGTSTFTVRITDASSQSATQTLSITIVAPPSITTSSLPGGIVGAAYNTTLAASGGAAPDTWSVVSGSLPAGLALASTTGVISGTPTAAGTSTFTLRITDSTTPTPLTADKTLSITVKPPPSITTSSLPNAVVSGSFSNTLAASGGTTPYTWSVVSGSLPAGLTLASATGVISGTPTAAGTSTFTLRITDSTTPTPLTADKTLSITVIPALVLTTALLPNARVAQAYSATLAASGGAAPYTWSIVSGSLPAGLSLAPGTDVISGTPTTAGTASFTVQVRDAASATASKALSIVVTPAVAVTTTSLPGSSANLAYSATLAASGGVPPYTWAIVSGSLPLGLALATSTGVISGTPALVGTSSFTVQVTDAASVPAIRVLSITINPAVSISTTSLPDGTAAAPYSTTVSAGGGATPYNWSLASGTLPAGLSLAAATGVISGTPTTAGTSSFTIQVRDANAQTASKPLSITVSPAPVPLSITTGSLASGTAGSPYSVTLGASGGIAPYTWSLASGTLPAGLALNSSTGLISGTPTTAASSTFIVQASDSTAPTRLTASKALSITINPAPVPLSITTAALPNGTAGASYSSTLAASGGAAPYAWAIVSGSLPAGLTLASTTGVISGTASSAGTGTFTVRAADSGTPTPATVNKTLNLTVDPAPIPLSITTAALPDGTGGAPYSVTLGASGGTAPYTWAITSGSLPVGLSLAATTGVISGTPASAWAGSFTVQATDSSAPTRLTTNRLFNLTIRAAPTPVSITTASLPSGTAGTSYSTGLVANGGTTPYTWSVLSGSLPAGLTLASGTGLISGTPAAAGTSDFVVRIADSSTPIPQAATKALSLTVNPAPIPLTITTTSLASGTASASYSGTLGASGGTAPYAWSIASGSLPAGLTLSPGTGAISGTPTTAGTSSFTVQATDSSAPTRLTASKGLNITVAPAPIPLSIVTASLPNGTATVSYSSTLSAGDGTAPYSWSIVGSLPAGLALAPSSGVISGTPITPGTSNFAVQVTDSSATRQTVSRPFSVTIIPAPVLLVITTPSLPNGVASAPYNATLAASGGTPPFNWTIVAGTLPTGLTLSSGTGVISGTPATAATSSFTVRVTDSSAPAQTANSSFGITVNPAPTPLSITTTTLPNGTASASYSATLGAGGGTPPYVWSIASSSLPAGLTLSSSTGVISGTPAAAGTSNFTVQVTDSGTPAPQTVAKLLSSTVNPAPVPLTITTTSLPNGTATALYGATMGASGGSPPYTWSIVSGSLPAGLTLAAGTGVISGTPSAAGPSTFAIQASDAGSQAVSTTLSITIKPASAPFTITSTSLPSGNVSEFYSSTLAASGGTAPYVWWVASGNLPTGLYLDPLTGVISGTPTAGGSSTFMVQAADSSAPAQISSGASLSITINAAPPPLIFAAGILPTGTANVSYSTTLSASGGVPPYAWSIIGGVLPDGLTLAPATGVISGTPVTAGTSSVIVQVRDATSQAVTASRSITVNAPAAALSVSTTSLPNGTANASYSASLVAGGGSAPYSWSITSGSLPAGLTFASATGLISGTPTTAGTSSFTVQVADSSIPVRQTASRILSININAAPIPLSITTASLPIATASMSYSTDLAATGGATPYSWSLVSGSLPPGLALTASTIWGTPTTAGTSSFAVRVTDANGQTASQSLSLMVTPAPGPVPTIAAVMDAASYSTAGAAPGSIGVLFGTNLSAGVGASVDIPLPTTMVGTVLTVNDIPVPLYYVSPFQINFQWPQQLDGAATATVKVAVNGLTSVGFPVNLLPALPGVFTLNQQGTGQGAIVFNGTGVLAAPVGTMAGARPAHRGEYVSIYCTGLGAVTNTPADGTPALMNVLSYTTNVLYVTIGLEPATVISSTLAPGWVGLYQVNVQVPAGAPSGDAVPVVLQMAGQNSNTVTMAIQ